MTPAEIRALCVATGLYDDFVGDGASVPWNEVTDPVWRFLLYRFKEYLDGLAPDAFKMHDFLYWQGSEAVPVTREQADFALFEELELLDPVSARIVYEAVRVGGGPNWRRPIVPVNRDNMVLAPFGVLQVANFKATMLFQLTTNLSGGATPNINRIAGWSESFYRESGSAAEVLAFMKNGATGIPAILPSRAALLPTGASIVGQRVQRVPPVGASITSSATYPGTAGVQTDVPSMGLLCTAVPLATDRVRRFTIRGIPDFYVVEGEFKPSAGFQTNLNNYFLSLAGFNVRGRDFAVTSYSINTISGTGLLTGVIALPFAVGDLVQVVGSSDVLGVKRSGVFQVLNTLPLTLQVQLKDWPYGATSGGSVKSNTFSFSSLNGGTFAVSRIVQRKVGRPFVGYRGRASRRRQTA